MIVLLCNCKETPQTNKVLKLKERSSSVLGIFFSLQNFVVVSEAVVQRCLVEKVFLNFPNFAGKYLCLSILFNKVADRKRQNLAETDR